MIFQIKQSGLLTDVVVLGDAFKKKPFKMGKMYPRVGFDLTEEGLAYILKSILDRRITRSSTKGLSLENFF